MAHISQKNITYIYGFIMKDIIKDADEQPDEGVQRAKSGRVWSTGASFPLEVGVYHLPRMWMCSPTQKLSEPHSFGIFMEASSRRHEQLLIPSPAPLRSLENGG